MNKLRSLLLTLLLLLMPLTAYGGFISQPGGGAESDPIVGAITGIPVGDGAGNISDASAVDLPFAPNGSIEADNVQNAIQEVRDDAQVVTLGAGPPNSGTVSAAKEFYIDTTALAGTTDPWCYAGAGVGTDFKPCTQGSDAFDSESDGINSINAEKSTPIRRGGANGLVVEAFAKTAAFTNQPTNDGVELISDNAGDTQSAVVCGTINGGSEDKLTCETVTLTGTSQVATAITNWQNILTVKLASVAVGTVTIREASGNAAITTITAGNTRAAHQNITVHWLDINGLTADGSPDTAADYVVTYDASAGRTKKVLLSSISSGRAPQIFRAQNHDAFVGGAALDTRNSMPILVFPDAADTSARFSGVMDANYAAGTITVRLHTKSVATSGDHRWCVSWERDTTDSDSDSFNTANCELGTVNGTSGITTIVSIAFTQAEADGIAAGEGYRLNVMRDGDDGDDDAAANAQLRMVEVRP